MHAFSLAPVADQPFPHVLADGWLEPELYAELARTFPECAPRTGPTGYTAFWGDEDYARLMESSPAWQALFDRFHSQAYVDYALAQFAPAFAAECVHDLSKARYVPYLEDRIDKERPALRRVVHAPDELYVRVDIMQGRPGYDREPHVDYRRRAVTLLIYFCDADEIGMEGGDLLLHGADGQTATVRARENRMAMFACTNASLHSVSPVARQLRPRNFVQVLLSSSVDLWQPLPQPRLGWRGLARKVKRLIA